ncbi:hypothetical protein BCR43DRAFT_474544 [Syncephalastrum racemosum]|uniref:Uncharacterized protein n=1 Tax=Syncephalastrum racemosum TaxID=13706 RepID=A0A1X2HD19_SYNRA|nr:hypothetical protein BCR43DRAFT_474544 [Syncephalastrum racemosum]
MATLFFADYSFPEELYSRDAADYATPIRTLLDFVPHILQELPKAPRDQKPLKPSTDQSSEFLQEAGRSKRPALSGWLQPHALTYARAFGKFLADCCMDYLLTERKDDTFIPHHEHTHPQPRYWTRRQRDAHAEETARQRRRQQEDEEDEEKEEGVKREKESEENSKKKDLKKKPLSPEELQRQRDKQQTYYRSAAAVGALTLSVYSTYQASASWGDITFHNQLELLLDHVRANIRSVRVWIEEHDAMHDKVPLLVREDLLRIEQLIDLLERLDPRQQKRMEVTGWGVGALGGLSTLGGLAVGSSAVATGGAALALGGVLVTIATKAQHSAKATQGARAFLEGEVRIIMDACRKTARERRSFCEAHAAA